MDFDSPAAAQKAVASLKASGVQAQMAKVSFAPICHAPSLIIKVFSRSAILLRDSVTVFKPCRKLRWVLLASEVMGDDISGQIINSDSSIDNYDNNYVIHYMGVSRIYVRLIDAALGQ